MHGGYVRILFTTAVSCRFAAYKLLQRRKLHVVGLGRQGTRMHFVSSSNGRYDYSVFHLLFLDVIDIVDRVWHTQNRMRDQGKAMTSGNISNQLAYTVNIIIKTTSRYIASLYHLCTYTIICPHSPNEAYYNGEKPNTAFGIKVISVSSAPIVILDKTNFPSFVPYLIANHYNQKVQMQPCRDWITAG